MTAWDSITELLQQLNWLTLETQWKNARLNYSLIQNHQQYTNHPYRILAYKIHLFHHQSSAYTQIYTLSNIYRYLATEIHFFSKNSASVEQS